MTSRQPTLAGRSPLHAESCLLCLLYPSSVKYKLCQSFETLGMLHIPLDFSFPLCKQYYRVERIRAGSSPLWFWPDSLNFRLKSTTTLTRQVHVQTQIRLAPLAYRHLYSHTLMVMVVLVSRTSRRILRCLPQCVTAAQSLIDRMLSMCFCCVCSS